MHSKIIRDADKLDNYRVKKAEKIEAIFPKRVNKKEDMEECLLSDKVYETVLNRECVNIYDRVTPLDFWVCILAFTFDLNFDVTYNIVKENDYINILIDRFDYKDIEKRTKAEEARVSEIKSNPDVVKEYRKILNEMARREGYIGTSAMPNYSIEQFIKDMKIQ